MDPFQRRDIVTVRIGKSGIGEPQLREIQNILKARGIVKVKLLRAYRDIDDTPRHQLAQRLAETLNAQLLGVRGYTFILKKKPRAKAPHSQSRRYRPPSQPRKP